MYAPDKKELVIGFTLIYLNKFKGEFDHVLAIKRRLDDFGVIFMACRRLCRLRFGCLWRWGLRPWLGVNPAENAAKAVKQKALNRRGFRAFWLGNPAEKPDSM